MKKIIAIMLCLAMTLCVFAGCSAAKKDDGSAKEYIIASDKSFAPFEFQNDDGTYVGVDVELLAAIAEDQGFKYKMTNDGFDAAMGSVQSGQADAMIAGMSITEKRQETFDFSDGYFEDGSILVVAQDNDTIKSEADLKGKKLAAKNGTVSKEYTESIKDKYGFEIIYFDQSAEMYQAVASGNADACFEDYSVIAYAIKEGDVKLKTIGEIVDNSCFYGFAVKKGVNPELVEMFNKGLENIKANGKYEEILNKYGYSSVK